MMALDPTTPVRVPSDYSLWRMALRLGVPPWVFEGYPLDEPPIEWIVRILEFHSVEQSVKVRRGNAALSPQPRRPVFPA